MPIYEYECKKCKDRFELLSGRATGTRTRLPVLPVEENPQADVGLRRWKIGVLFLRRNLLQPRLRPLSRCGGPPHFHVAKLTRIGYKARAPQSPSGEAQPKKNRRRESEPAAFRGLIKTKGVHA